MSFSVRAMTQPKLLIPPAVAKLIKHLHPDLKQKIKKALKTIISDPTNGRALKDELAGLFSYRVKRFRIIYRIEPGKQIEIVTIGPRKYIYEETFRIISRETKR